MKEKNKGFLGGNRFLLSVSYFLYEFHLPIIFLSLFLVFFSSFSL